MSTTRIPRSAEHTSVDRAQVTAAVTAGLMALIYALLATGLLAITGAEAGERGILGVTAGLFVVLAVALRRWRSRTLWVTTAAIQLVMAAMYVAIAPERDPAFERWGLTLRGLSLVLLVAVLTMLLDAHLHRRIGAEATTGPTDAQAPSTPGPLEITPVAATVPLRQAAEAFLAQRRIAVVGVSRDPAGSAGNLILRRLRERGYEVFPVNPHAEEVEGERCYPDLATIPGGVEAVVIATPPQAAEATVRRCAELGIEQVWMHRSFGAGSVCATAATVGREHGLTVLDGGCPLMFSPADDPVHRLMRGACQLAGTVPRRV